MRMKNLDDFCIDCPDYGKDTDRCKECKKVIVKPKKNYWANICEINKKQEEKGIRTYGQCLEDNNIPGFIDRIEYIEEELVDALKYLEWLKDKYNDGTSESLKFYELGKCAAEGFKQGINHSEWHILNDNPKDLPTWSHDVLICMERPNGRRGYFVVFYNSENHKFIFQNRIEHPVDIKSWDGRVMWKEIEE